MSEREELPETCISVDIETAGPNPSQYSLLSIGACLLDEPERGFYIELKPVNDAFVEGSLSIGGLSMATLAADGVEPAVALERFEAWLAEVVPEGHRPVFVAFNAPFDWMFIEDYFRRFLGRNPFGYSALDMKAYYMGMAGVAWARTSMRYLSPRYLGGRQLSHNALGDARDQAQLFRAMLAERSTLRQE
jgi:ribonuclease T